MFRVSAGMEFKSQDFFPAMLLHHKQYLDISKQKFGLNSILYMLDAVILGLLDISIMIYMRFGFGHFWNYSLGIFVGEIRIVLEQKRLNLHKCKTNNVYIKKRVKKS